jgi:hypothetical protein
MNVSTEDADLFFRLMWPLQFYVKQRLQLLPHLNTLEAYRSAAAEEKLSARNALYANLNLLDDFVAENSAGFSADELAIIKSWRRLVQGNFYIERFLRSGAIFIGGENSSQVYSVLGLYDDIKDIFYASPLPIYVQAVLLPFKGRIVYDGLLSAYRVYFGSGIRGDLKETYMAAKQKGRIVETLEPGPAAVKKATPAKPLPDWQPTVNQIAETTKQLKGSRQAPVQSEAINLLKASATLAQAAISETENLDELWQLMQKAQRALNRLETTLHRAEQS